MSEKKKVLFVCLGNICRSPLAEGIFNKKIQERGLEDRFEADSCGTGSFHIGEKPDPRTLENARKNNVPIHHRARQLGGEDLVEFDHILVMDESNLSNTLRHDHENRYSEKVELIRNYDDSDKGADVPDPYFGGAEGFQKVHDILDRSIENWLDKNRS